MSEVDHQYTGSLERFTRVAKRSYEASISASGVQAGQQRYWASIILTRVCCLCTSLLQICPRSVLNERGLNWDFEGVAALSRSIFEALLMLFYLGLEQLPEPEWKARITLVHLADCTERIRLFHQLDNQEQVAGFVGAAVDLRNLLLRNSYFQSLPAKQQKDLLSGERATVFGKSEIVRRANEDPDKTLNFYRFLSNYMHSFPFGFHRTAEHLRIGTENDVDKGYSSLALDFIADWLEKSVERFEQAFSDVVRFDKRSFDFEWLRAPAFTPRDEALIKKVFNTGQ